jgi:hypothetical protein
MQNEYEPIEDEKHVSQGDIIVWHDRAYVRPWHTYGMIVTADCDLAWDKHKGRISYVPAFLTEDFLWHHWRPSEFQQHCDAALETMALRINKWLRKRDVAHVDLSTEAIASWGSRVGSEKLLDELGVGDKGERNTLQRPIDDALELQSLLSTEIPDLDLLRRCHALKPGKKSDTRLVSDCQKAMSELPGDIFHLPALHDQDDEGLFLMLRHITQCDASVIALSPDDLRFGNAQAKRVAKVMAPYRYAITQALARVFADIGLPKEYEVRCKQSAARFFAQRKEV